MVIVIHYRHNREGEDNVSLVQRILKEFPIHTPTIAIEGVLIKDLQALEELDPSTAIIIQ